MYLDNAATTMLDPGVVEAMRPFQEDLAGNPSSLHHEGVRAAKGVEKARAILADRIGARAEEIVFTSGGTESNNLAMKGAVWASAGWQTHLVTTRIEHVSILRVGAWLERFGCEVTLLPVDPEGFVSAGDVRTSLRSDTLMVSIGQVNNEIGTIQPISEIGRVCRERGVLFHVDACQSFTKVPLDVSRDNIDLLTLSAHKIHGPAGVGALFVREGVKLEPLLHGGSQESGLRAGSHNTAGIVGFGKAAELASDDDAYHMGLLRDQLLAQIETRIEGTRLNGPRQARVANNVNISFSGVASKDLMFELDRHGVCVSQGSACASGTRRRSHVLEALGLADDEIDGAVRLTLSKWTALPDITEVVDHLAEIVERLRSRS